MIFLNNVSKILPNGQKILNKIHFEVKEGEILVLLGKSGSGKTTALKMINRLEMPSEGTISIQGKNIEEEDPILLRRKIGYVVQSIALFPHFTVEENIAVIPKLLSWDKKKINDRIDELLLSLGMDPEKFRHRYPYELSGGQKQRVGVARALAGYPPILLMDEPFGALDPITRRNIQKEFLGLVKKIGKTVVFVTHDIVEALFLADRIALLEKGELLQLSSPKEFFQNPADDTVSQFFEGQYLTSSLITNGITEFITKLSPGEQPIDMPVKAEKGISILEAIIKFKKTKTSQLSIFDQGEFVGVLQKDKILNEILSLLK